jgi:hypothetical protein
MKIRPKSILVLKQRDYTILKLLYDYRFLSGELIWYLIRKDSNLHSVAYTIGSDRRSRPNTYGFKKQALFKRLKQLYDSRYVERHYVTDQPMGRGYGSPRAIYGLGLGSSKVLKEIYEIPQYIIKRTVESNNVKSPFLRHTLEVARFRVILELACQQYNKKVELLFWEQSKSIQDFVYGYNEQEKKEKYTIYADAFFGLKIANQKNRHFFLEIDRGTEPIVSKTIRCNIRRKLIGYQYYYKSKKILDRYPNGVSGFQILIVTPGKIEGDLKLSGRIANIHQELFTSRRLYTLTSLFLLTSPKCMSLQNPETVFSEIWISVKSQKSLLNLIE